MFRIQYRYFFLVTLITFSFHSRAQFDTSYAVKYADKIGVSVFQSKPSYTIDFERHKPADSSGVIPLSYRTLSNFLTGFGVHYDKISFFIGFKTPGDISQESRKGKTSFSHFNINITGIKLRIEASVRHYKGFYENNSPSYIPDFNDSLPYFRNSGMKNNSFKIKAFYFLNAKKRFSYGAAYLNNVRQLKSAGSFIIAANVYKDKINSDQPIIPYYSARYYIPWSSLNKVTATGISAGIGYTFTFTIFERIFLNVLASIGAEEQHIVFGSSEGNNYDNWRLRISAYDLRSSLGYNSNRFFFSLQNIIDGNAYRTPDINFTNRFINTVFIIGYRFGLKAPGFYRKIQESKVYKML